MQTTGHCGFALGVGRRALDAVTELAQTKKRGYKGTMSLVADRGSFQRFLGESELRLRAARALVLEIIEEAWGFASQGITPPIALQAMMRALATFSTENGDITYRHFDSVAGQLCIALTCYKNASGILMRPLSIIW
ncbi:MAG: hypothetical protein Ct9H300mP27_04820 [Chloroflexota bacterium]|nr:MAG: hypothetical protein Ct9H300mP27_04820 [Chloroflexota bacterium]